MSAPDFAAIIEDVLDDQFNCTKPGWYSEDAAAALAAPIAAMCPDCKGRGWFIDMDDMGCERTCLHRNAPTVGQALHEWADAHQRAATNRHTIAQAMKVYETVMGCEATEANWSVETEGGGNYSYATDLLAALRSVAK